MCLICFAFTIAIVLAWIRTFGKIIALLNPTFFV